MVRWLLLVIALALATLSSLTAMKSPDWAPWKLAVLAGEFGHWLVPLPLAVAGLAWFARGEARGVAVAIVLVCVVAIGLLLRPCFEAWRIGRALPAELEKRFGHVELTREPFAISALFGAAPEPVPVETLAYSGDLALDFYRPPAPTRASSSGVVPGKSGAPCVIVVHGGGWDGGDRNEIAPFNHWLARRGYAVASISYRLAPQFPWPAQRDDVLAAIAFLKSHADRLGVDPTRLVLFGRSAGGNIAEATAYAAGDPAIRGVIAFYAPADMHFAWAYARADDVLKSPILLRQFLGGTPDEVRTAYDSASGILHVSRAAPPTLLVHGQLDTLVWHRQSERLAVKLEENGVPHVFVSLPWATHACEYNLHGPGGQLTTFAVEWYLAAVTK